MVRVWGWRAVLVAAAAGCGFGGPSGSPGTPGPVDGAVADAADAAIDAAGTRTCLDRWRAGTVNLSAPERLEPLDSIALDRDPFVSDDELTIYFSSERRPEVGEARVFAAKRANTNAAFAAPVERTDLSGDLYDSRFTMTRTELIGVVASQRSTSVGGSSDLWLATRASTTVTFGTPSSAELMFVNTVEDELDPEISDDGLHLYFARGNPQRLFLAVRPLTGTAFTAGLPVVELGSEAGRGDADPSVSSDERVLVFASRRGNGDADLWYSRRAPGSLMFEHAAEVPAVNSSADDGDPALSADGCSLYFASNRNGNDWEILVSRVIP